MTDNLRPHLNWAKRLRQIKNFELEDKNLYSLVWDKLCYLRSWSLYAPIPKISFVCKNGQVVSSHTYTHTPTLSLKQLLNELYLHFQQRTIYGKELSLTKPHCCLKIYYLRIHHPCCVGGVCAEKPEFAFEKWIFVRALGVRFSWHRILIESKGISVIAGKFHAKRQTECKKRNDILT